MPFFSFYRQFAVRYRQKEIVVFFLIALMGVWFSWDLFTLKKYLNHPEYVDYYPAYRSWFLEHLKRGIFPVWNPYWGIGHSPEIEASFPIDIFSLVEWVIGPKYHWFYPLQAIGILYSVYFATRTIGFSIALSCLASSLFFFSPWVNYFFFYWIKASSFIGLWLSFAFGFQFLKKGFWKDFLLLSISSAIALFGTKLDFWFFHLAFLALMPLVFHLSIRKISGRIFFRYIIALTLSLGCHVWQIVPLSQILSQANRLGYPMGIGAFTNSNFYFKLILSLASSDFLKVSFVCLLFFYSLSNRKFFLGAVLIAGIFKVWILAPFSWLFSSYGLGALLALFIFLAKRPNPRELFQQFLFFLPLSFYWCRPVPQDLNEITIMKTSPILLQGLWGFLTFFAAGTWKNPMGKFGILFLVILFILRDQGQVVLSHLFGLVWIPTRDNYLFDLIYTCLALLGISHFFVRATHVSLLLTLLVVWSVRKNPYYSHPLVEKTPIGYPFYEGREKIRNLLQSLNLSATDRVYFVGSEYSKNLSMYGASLLTRVNQVHTFSSFVPQRYHDWSTYQWFGIKPEDRWESYQGEYSPATIEKLPPRDTKGMTTNQVYWWALHAMPPPNVQALRLLGVKYLISQSPLPKESAFKRIEQRGEYFLAELKDPIPRAFTVSLTGSKLIDWQHRLSSEIKESLANASIELYSENEIRLKAQGGPNDYLVLTDLYHPFWKVERNGVPVEMLPALGIFRMVALPPGTHTLRFYSIIPRFKVAVGLSLLSVGFLLVSLFTICRNSPHFYVELYG